MTPHPFNAHAGWAPPGSLQKLKPPALPTGQLCQVLAATQVANGWQVDYLELSPKSDVDLGIETNAGTETNALPVEAPNADRWTALIPSAVSAAKPKTGALIIVFDAPSSDFKWAILAPDIQKTADDAARTGPAYGLGSILGMGPADCVEFSSPGGVGRCSPVLAFKVKGVWTGEQEWTASATASTPLGDATQVFTVVDETPALVWVFSGGSAPDPVVFKLVDVGSHCAIFVTTDRRICTAAPGGPCETNALVVAVCCVPCESDVTQYCSIPQFDMRFPGPTLCDYLDHTESAYPGGASYYPRCGGSGTSMGEEVGSCGGYGVYLSWNAAHTAIVARFYYSFSPVGVAGYETVRVLSWLPFHATITTTADMPGAPAGTVIELWQRNGAETGTGCEKFGPQPPVLCDACPDGVAVQAWTANLCCLTGSTGEYSQPTMSYAGGCTWTSAAGFTVTAAGGKLTLTWPGAGFPPVYEGDIPADCCSPVVLTRVRPADPTAQGNYLLQGCLPLFPADGPPKKWPDTVTIVPYGECGRPPCGTACPGGAPLSYDFTLTSTDPASAFGFFRKAMQAWKVPYRAASGEWKAQQGQWVAKWTPGASPGAPATLRLSALDNPGVYLEYTIGMSDCCTRSGSASLTSYAPTTDGGLSTHPPLITGSFAVTATGGCSCSSPPPPPCDISGCPGGAATQYNFGLSGGDGMFAAATGSGTVTAADQGGGVPGWSGTLATISPSLFWQIDIVPGSPGMVRILRTDDPTQIYAEYEFTLSDGCCGKLTGWSLIDVGPGATGTPPTLDTLNTVGSPGGCTCTPIPA